MPAAAFVTLAALLLKDGDFFIFFIFEDSGLHAGTFHEGRAEASIRALAEHEDLLDTDGVAGIGFGVGVYLEDVPLGHGELSALCTDCRFHGKSVVAKHSYARNQAEFRIF